MGSELFVPLRSNAQVLVAGAPVATFRQRLKTASLFFDRIHLEGGQVDIQAGPHASSSWMSANVDAPFQRASDRHQSANAAFSIAIGAETTPGVPSTDMRTVASSATSIAWQPTLHPFSKELPVGCDWIGYVTAPRSAAISQTASEWSRRDERNPSLLRRVPEEFVRSLIIKHCNGDMAVACNTGSAIMMDAIHREVPSSRLDANDVWNPVGFAVPVLLPNAGRLGWEDIVLLRQDKSLAQYMAIMHNLESDALAEARNGDLETAAHHMLEKYLASAASPKRGRLALGINTAAAFAIGSLTGALTSGWTGMTGILAGAGVGTVVDFARGVTNLIRTRGSRAWITLHNELLDRAG